MIGARAAGFKPGGKDAHGNRDTDAPPANQIERAGERTPRPTTWFSLADSHRVFVSVGSAPRPPAARRGRQTTMHDSHDTTSAREEVSETRAMSTLVHPPQKRVDTENRSTGRRYSSYVQPSTPICILSRSEEEERGKRDTSVKKRFAFWGGRLDMASPTLSPSGDYLCPPPTHGGVDEGGHNSGEVIG